MGTEIAIHFLRKLGIEYIVLEASTQLTYSRLQTSTFNQLPRVFSRSSTCGYFQPAPGVKVIRSSKFPPDPQKILLFLFPLDQIRSLGNFVPPSPHEILRPIRSHRRNFVADTIICIYIDSFDAIRRYVYRS